MDANQKALTQRICECADEKNAENIIILDVEGHCSYADAVIVCQGRSTRQTIAIAQNISSQMKKEKHPPIGMEGETPGHWVLVDFGDIVVHVFYEPVREYYDIENLWPEVEPKPFSQ